MVLHLWTIAGEPRPISESLPGTQAEVRKEVSITITLHSHDSKHCTYLRHDAARYSAMFGIVFALNILPALVNGHGCRLSNNECSHGDTSSLLDNFRCMVSQWSVSAFI